MVYFPNKQHILADIVGAKWGPADRRVMVIDSLQQLFRYLKGG